MRVDTELSEIIRLVKEAYESGAEKVLAEIGHKDFMYQNEAFRKYGRITVEKWRDAGLIRVFKDGERSSRIRIPIEDLHRVSMSSNIHKLVK
ncbi:hypothetical protein [Parabacteroides sp. AM08-6]|uniref:hypothetical protein n=1 Tax=Parabacteroides sp. AM08-6 TaxID=2292053 RepID=UPI0011C353E1|nr:hypothetical protein [Parabacteroides sp. AM08-6]